jgi:hypothetical protein
MMVLLTRMLQVMTPMRGCQRVAERCGDHRYFVLVLDGDDNDDGMCNGETETTRSLPKVDANASACKSDKSM